MLERTEGQYLDSHEDYFNFNANTHESSDDNHDENQLTNHETNIKKSKKLIYGKGSESIAIKKELGDFDAFSSESFKYIIKKYGRSIRFTELLGIINSIQIYLQYKNDATLPQLSRNEKRSFPLLIKYIEGNKEIIFPYLQFISLCDSSFQKIDLDNK